MGSGVVFFTDYAASVAPTTDGAWHDWGLSSYIPATANESLVRMILSETIIPKV